MLSIEARFLFALAATCAIETAVLAGGWRWLGRGRPRRWYRLCLAGVLPSAMSLPYLWFVLPHFVNGPAYIPLGEGLVVLVEAPVLAALLDWRPARALVASLLCNAGSYFLGPWLLRAVEPLLPLLPVLPLLGAPGQ
jgi:hypothetical protein